MWKNKRLIAAMVPLLALLIWTVSVALTHSAGDTWRVRIVGYDPIDPLSGHYLRFRFDFGPLSLCDDALNKTVCACVEPNSEQLLEATAVLACASAGSSCSQHVSGECQGGLLMTGTERYYFPENYASPLATLPPESTAEIRLNAAGRISLQNIFVKSQPILEYAKMRIEGQKP